MSTLVIVGAQWGDEAKGKLVDVLGGQADMVVRYAGGNNAGHTVISEGKTYKFQLIPAGILHTDTIAILGSGMVICPEGLLQELARTREQKSELGTLYISSAAHVVFPYNRTLDALEEAARGANKIGTTSRGIGPAYQDKVARIGIRMGEFVRPEMFRERLREILLYKNRLITLLGGEPFDFDALYAEYAGYADQLRPLVIDSEPMVQEAVARGDKVLFEGAQGTFLDLDSGTYPFVTSSHPVAGGACLGTGVGPRSIQNILGVAKAYTTRVGSGPFPTEQDNAIGQQIRDQGHEYGTVTGRGRRCGWLDLVALKHACRLNSLSGLVMTRLDVLANVGDLQMATGYAGRTGFPANVWDLAEVTPEYVTMPGWTEDLRGCRHYNDLPSTVHRYLEFIEEYTETPVAVISIGPDRKETIVKRPDLIWGA